MVELVIAMAVAAILLGVGVPSFNSAIKNSRQSSTYQSMVGALFLARSEAVKRSTNITVCARKSSVECGSSTEWDKGWIVFNEITGPGTQFGRLDPGETVIGLYEETKNEIGVLGIPRGTSDLAPQHFVQYGPVGSSNWTGGTISICDDRDAPKALAMNIVLTGDIRKARSSGGDETTPMNVNGDPVECP